MRIFIAMVLFSMSSWASVDAIVGKRFPTRGRFELALFPLDFSVAEPFVAQPYALHGTAGYHIFDWFAVEVYGGYVPVSGETDILAQVRHALVNAEPQLSRMWQTSYFAGANLQWAPLYGKLSLLSLCETHVQLYVLVGGGVDGIRKMQVLQNQYAYSVQGALNVGAGVRIFLADFAALRLEWRDDFRQNPGESGIIGTNWLQFGVGFFL